MVRTKADGFAGGKSTKAADAKGVQKPEYSKVTVVTGVGRETAASLNEGETVESMNKFVQKRKKAITKQKLTADVLLAPDSSDDEAQRRKKRKEADASERKPKVKTVHLTGPGGCHHCKRLESPAVHLVDCGKCSRKYCERCLLLKYDLVQGTYKTGMAPEPANAPKKTDDDSKAEIPDEVDEKKSKKNENSWRCPYCQGVCACAGCRKRRGLTPLGSNHKKFKERIASKFNTLLEYYHYEKDHPEVAKGDVVIGKNKKPEKIIVEESSDEEKEEGQEEQEEEEEQKEESEEEEDFME
eukprot:TRINITY_DN5019_c0_g1_i1.p1 TRINITY_DN5019_c0_g1~~TRINITY_DN5019_c0_g1_i1.p1  ORF type:complete len:298 (-),score=85.69 TRINITY_DN5019_c0_g1_i1:20-913(-)